MAPEKSMTMLATFPNKSIMKNKDGKRLFTWVVETKQKIDMQWGLSVRTARRRC